MPTEATWNQLQHHYAIYLEGHGRAVTTIRSYLSDLQQFTHYLEVHAIPLELPNITYAVVMEFLAEQRRQFSLATLERRRTSLLGWIKWLALDHPPVPALSLILSDRLVPTPHSPSLPVFLTRTESVLFLKALNHSVYSVDTVLVYRDQALFRMMLSTGMRISEILSMTVDGIESALATKEFRILGKGSRERMIPVHPELQSPITAWLLRRPSTDTPHCFTTRRGLPLRPRDVQRLIQRYAVTAGIRKHVTPHTLRHTFATLLLDANVNLRLIQRLLGHSSLAITERYTHIQTAGLHEAIAALDFTPPPT